MTRNQVSMLTALSIWLLASGTAHADDLPLPTVNVLTKGVICDTQDQLHVYLSAIAIDDGLPRSSIKGCGTIKGLMPALITPIGWYETPVARTLVASFKTPEGWVQYGWIKYELTQSISAGSET